MLPAWIIWVVGLGGFVTAVGTLWKMVLNPLRKAGNKAEKMYPLLMELTEVFATHPHYFTVLDNIADQFKADHGSSLMDHVQSLKQSAADNKQAAEVLKVGVESARVLAERDREQLMRLIILLDRLDAKVSGGRGALDRMELERSAVAHDLAADRKAVAGVADDLVIAQTAVAGVATNLARAQSAVDGVAAELVTDKTQTAADRARVAEDLRLAQMQVDAVAIELEANSRRLAAARELVAMNLLKAQEAVDGVASDLTAAHERADAVLPGRPPGDAADAASRSDDIEEGVDDAATRAWVASQTERRLADPAAEQAYRDSGLPERRAR